MSANGLASQAGVNPSYITRMRSGDRPAPSRPILEAFIRALKLSDMETVKLAMSAGLLPRGFSYSDVLYNVAKIMNDPEIDYMDKMEFDIVVSVLCKKWRMKSKL